MKLSWITVCQVSLSHCCKSNMGRHFCDDFEIILQYLASWLCCKFASFSLGSSAILLEGKVGQEGVKWK